MNHTPGPWYGKKAGNDSQGLIIDEATGRNIAVAYDARDTDLLAAAPDLLAALQAINARITGEFDNPVLAAVGPLSVDSVSDCQYIALTAIAKATQS